MQMRRLVATVAVAAVGAVTGTMTAAAPAGAEDFSPPFTGFAPANTVLRDVSPASFYAWRQRLAAARS
jgi:hypothetical protein